MYDLTEEETRIRLEGFVGKDLDWDELNILAGLENHQNCFEMFCEVLNDCTLHCFGNEWFGDDFEKCLDILFKDKIKFKVIKP